MESEIQFVGAGGCRIAGVLTMPAASSNGCGVVLVGGSGPSTRDNGGFFLPLRRHLSRAGVAALSYDKRGAGRSEGRWESATINDLAEDARAAIGFLRNHPAVDPERVSLFGHSEGGWVALRACVGADRPPSVLVLNSCPSVSFIESEVFAQEATGCSPEEANEVRRLLTGLADLAAAGGSLEGALDRIAAVREDAWLKRIAASGFELDETTWSQLRAWGQYSPDADLCRCTVPTVALLGAEDPLVPLQASIERYDQTALAAGRTHANHVFARAGHRMTPRGSDELVPDYLDCVRRYVNPLSR